MQQSEGRRNILIISHDVVGDKMAGPGIRFLNLARVLSREFDVTLAIPNESERDFRGETFRIAHYQRGNWATIEELARIADIVLCPSDIASDFLQLGANNVPLVIDGYDPLWAEWLASTQMDRSQQEAHWQTRLSNLTPQYLVGDFFICASERQRDWWLGILEATGRINPYTFRDDPSLRRLIDVVPYGLSDDPPRPSRRVIKGVWDGIGNQDRVILWGGGLWPWLDPLTAIRAIAQVYQQRQDTRLIFPGIKHPNPILKDMPTHNDAARDLAKQLGLLDKVVFFGDWVPYDDWQNVLLESDVALALHGEETFESRLAFRSRVLDYIWADLPVVATCGDATSDLIAKNGLGIVVGHGDVQGVADAIMLLLNAPSDYKKRIEQLRPTLTWERAAQPLIEFCRTPRRSQDKTALGERLGSPYYVAQKLELQSEAARLTSLIANLQNENSRLTSLIANLQNENSRLTSLIANLQNENSRLTSPIANLQNENSRLQAALEQAGSERDQFRSESRRLDEILRAYERRRAVRFANWLQHVLEGLRRS